jgi:hypothetical protein
VHGNASIIHPGPPPERLEANETKCSHDRLRLVWRVFQGKNQSRRYGMQCIDCGRSGHKTAAGEIFPQWVVERNCWDYFGCDTSAATPWDTNLIDRIYRERDLARSLTRQSNSALWWSWYSSYLDSPAWKQKRQKVLSRDNFMCLGCGGAAQQVHHVSYKNVGYEPLEDLASICVNCHRHIHGA